MGLLIVLVALAGVSPVFAPRITITFDPPAACPGERVTFAEPFADIVGGGISIAAASPLFITVVVSSSPAGLATNPECSLGTCSFVVSESASCGHYTVTVTLPIDESGPIGSAPSVSGPFDVAGPCCAVGGCVQPVNTFALLSPWLAVIGLVGCIGTVAVVAKKRES